MSTQQQSICVLSTRQYNQHNTHKAHNTRAQHNTQYYSPLETHNNGSTHQPMTDGQKQSTSSQIHCMCSFFLKYYCLYVVRGVFLKNLTNYGQRPNWVRTSSGTAYPNCFRPFLKLIITVRMIYIGNNLVHPSIQYLLGLSISSSVKLDLHGRFYSFISFIGT